MKYIEQAIGDIKYAGTQIKSTIDSGAEAIQAGTKSKYMAWVGLMVQPLIINVFSNTIYNTAYDVVKNARRTLLADRAWMTDPAVLEGIGTQISNIPDSAIGFMPTYSALETRMNVPMGVDYVPECSNLLGDMIQVDNQPDAHQMVKDFVDHCSSSEAFTGNRIELFVHHLPEVIQSTGKELASRAIETVSHPLANWLNGLGFVTRTDENGLAQTTFNPDSVLPLAAFLSLFYGADYGLRQLAANKDNRVANLYNRSLSELNGAEKAVRFTIDGILAAGTLGGLIGIIEAIK